MRYASATEILKCCVYSKNTNLRAERGTIIVFISLIGFSKVQVMSLKICSEGVW